MFSALSVAIAIVAAVRPIGRKPSRLRGIRTRRFPFQRVGIPCLGTVLAAISLLRRMEFFFCLAETGIDWSRTN